jgi:hypothetical protein
MEHTATAQAETILNFTARMDLARTVAFELRLSPT